MRSVLCVAFIILISMNLAFAQEDGDFIFGHWGLNNIYGLDPFFDFNSSGYGARSQAMGGTFYAFNNMGYGSFLNPAGMAFTSKALMSIDLFSNMDKHSGAVFVPTPWLSDPETGWYFALNQSDIDISHNRIDQAGGVTPFTYFDRDWWFGGGFRTVYDLHSQVATPTHVPGERALFTQDKGVDAANMAIASSIYPNIYLGVNLNIYVRGYEQDRYWPESFEDQYGDTITINWHFRDKSTFTGSNFNLGIMADYDIIKAGLVVETPLTLTQKSVATRGIVNVYGETEGLLDRITIKNNFPTTFGGGIAFMPIENATFGIDVTHKPFSKVSIDVDPEPNLWADSAGYNPNWEDLTQFRFGAEYIFDAGFARIPVRAGIQNLPGLYKNSATTIQFDTLSQDVDQGQEIFMIGQDLTTIGDQFNTYLYTFGTGIQFDKIWFDVAYQYGSSSYNQNFEIDFLFTGEEFLWDDSREYKYSRLRLSVGMLF